MTLLQVSKIHDDISKNMAARGRGHFPYMSTVEPVLSSHAREAKNLAAEGRWLFNAVQIYREMLIWDNSKWLLNTGGCS